MPMAQSTQMNSTEIDIKPDHHTIRKLLFENYEYQEGSAVEQPELIQFLSDATCTTVPPVRLVTYIIKQTFPGVSTKRVRRSGDWVGLCTSYTNLGKKRVKEKDIKSEEQILKEAGFTSSRNGKYICGCLPTEVTADGKRLCKEIEVNEEGGVTVKFGGRKVKVTELPERIDRKEASWKVLCGQVKEMRMCEGYECEEGEKSELWEVVGGGEGKGVYRRHAENCCVGLPSQIKSICHKCQKSSWNLQRSSSKTNQNEADDDENDDIEVDREDHSDLQTIMNKLQEDPQFKGDDFVELMKTQMENRHKKEPRSRRWPLSFIQYCLGCWASSPSCYANMANNYLTLPSGRLLQYYKNSMQQTSGINPALFSWMAKEADAKKLAAAGRSGCLALDEVKIQSDIMLQPQGQNFKLVGFVDAGPYCNDLQFLKTGLHLPQLAQFVLQFVFVGHTGFKFLVAHWPSNEASSAELDDHLEKVVDSLHLYGFTVDAVLTDGACSNRAMVKQFFQGHPRNHLYTISDALVPGHKRVFISDPSHLIKKLRNNLMKSQCSDDGTRLLQWNGEFICWDYWQEAESWDAEFNMGHRIHHKLTESKVDVNKASKMRNSFAFLALNSDMWHLMKEYQSFLGGDNGEHLSLTVKLLQHTASLCQLFLSMHNVNSSMDPLIINAEKALRWFKEWEISVNNDNALTKKEKWRALLSWECREDLESAVIGYKQLIEIRNRAFPGQGITPSLVNTDCVENVFCQVRAVHNGANNNPTYLQYLYTLNTIMLSAGFYKKNSNAGCNKMSAMPFNFTTPGPLNPKK